MAAANKPVKPKAPASKGKSARPNYDWERIEREFRAGQLSMREIARKHGPSVQAISKRAKKDGWQRDLTKAVQQRVRQKLVDKPVDRSNADDAEIIEEAADRGAAVIQSHRRDINEGRQLCGMLLQELRSGTEHAELIEDLVEQQADDEAWDARRRSAARRAISLPSRAGVMRDLATSMKTLQGLERTAFNLDERPSDKDPLDELLDAVSDTSRGIDGYGAADE